MNKSWFPRALWGVVIVGPLLLCAHGGWAVPHITDTGWENVLGPVVLLTKVMLVAFLMFWVRFTYPRLREDQLQAVAWKFLIPIGLANILITGALKVAF